MTRTTLTYTVMLISYLSTCVVICFLCVPASVESYKVLPEILLHPNWKLLNRSEDCGYSGGDRIIGGRVARLGQYPWIARLGYYHNGKVSYRCGGSIISDLYVLTAAHCNSDPVRHPLVQVRLGEYDKNSDIDCQDGVCAPPVQDINVEEVTCHQNFDKKRNTQHDICLVRLALPIMFNKFVYPICLPVYDFFQHNQFEGKIMEVAGWGEFDIRNHHTSRVLLTLNVPVLNHRVCKYKYNYKNLLDTQICAGGVVGQGSCRGDSGGPLMIPLSLDAPPRYFHVGIVSFGPAKCAGSTKPGVYTNVFLYMKWILDNVRA